MFESCESKSWDGAADGDAHINTPAPGRRAIAKNDILFQQGDMRSRMYRVERGAFCHYMQWPDGRHELIEFAFPGDIVGFGFLADHVSTAQAVVDSEVTEVCARDFEREARTNGQLEARLSVAADREFEAAKQIALEHRGEPMQRVAQMLTTLASIGVAEEGVAIIADDLTSGFIADRLDMSSAEITEVLHAFEDQGLVYATKSGLRLRNLPALEKLALAA